MEDILQYNFTIKSKIHDYSVEFIDDVKATLTKELKKGDFIIIDNKVKFNYPEWFEEVLINHNYIAIDASEPQKSYQEVEPVINSLIERGFRKNHRLIAVGGGITQDITAFIASISNNEKSIEIDVASSNTLLLLEY